MPFPSKTRFLSHFPNDRGFWRHLRKSVVPFAPGEIPDRASFLDKLYEELRTSTYFPSPPRAFIALEKDSGVPRFQTAFHHAEYCVYFFCVREIEEFIATNRVSGTFGGWTLGNPLRKSEESETNQESAVGEGEYEPPLSLNKYAWREHWTEFQSRAFDAMQRSGCNWIVMFDLANFYDSVNHSILFRHLRAVCPPEYADILDLLQHFLSYTLRPFSRFTPRSVGLPQDEVGDCSRILANFYLQSYDQQMARFCAQTGCQYLRYADDQIIFGPDRRSLEDLVFFAARELFAINLNINVAKVRYLNVAQFQEYWAWELFELIGDGSVAEGIAKALECFLEWRAEGKQFRWQSVLRRLLNSNWIGLRPAQTELLLRQLLQPEFLRKADAWMLTRIAHKLRPNRRIEMFRVLDHICSTTFFNGFIYNVLQFYSEWRKGFDVTALNARLDEIRIYPAV